MLPDTPSLLLFLTASVALLVTPGPAVFYIVARSVDQGRLAGFVSTLGVAFGSLVILAGTAAGVAAVIASSAVAFAVLKYTGAAYLVYMGVRRILSRDPAPGVAPPPRRRLPRIFWQGVVVNVLNPKTALFFLAFLPQFVDPARGPVAMQVMLLGLMFVLLGTFSDTLYALLAGSVGSALRRRGGFMTASRWLVGGTFIGLGVLTALAGTGRQQ